VHNSPSQAIKGRLLVVDDDPGARQSLSAILSQEGYETRCAPDGRTALMLAEAEPPELILLDVRLPDLDGFEICRRLKESEQTGRVPVIFLIGLEEPGDKIRGFESGGIDYITKPFHTAEVLARVETHLVLHRLRTQAGTQGIVLDAIVQERTRELTDLTESLVREIVQKEKAEESLEGRLRFEHLLSEISARLINVTNDRLDEEIENGLRMILEFLQVDRCGLLRGLPEKHAWIVTHAVYSEYVPPVPKGVELPRSINPWAYEDRKSTRLNSSHDV
jgi:DNA-binding response OmpR family regulator